MKSEKKNSVRDSITIETCENILSHVEISLETKKGMTLEVGIFR